MSLADWLIPVALGAAIGYLTNSLAIRMLFRPLKEIRVFGIALPFTPGIIPRQRHQLGKSLGRAVSKDLLNESVVRARLADPVIKEQVASLVDKGLSDILDRPLASLAGAEAPPLLKEALGDALKAIVSHASFDVAMGTLAKVLVDQAWGLRLGGLVSREAFVDALAGLSDTWAKGGSGPSKFVDGNVARAPIPFLPLDERDFARSVAGAAYPGIAALFSSFISRRETRAILVEWGRAVVRIVLGKLSGLQRFFVTAAKYDRTIDERMPEIVEDLVASVKRAAQGDDAKSQFAEFVASSLASGLKGDGGAPRDEAASFNLIAKEAVGAVVAYSAEGRGRERLLADAAAFYDAHEDRSLGDFLSTSLGLGPEAIVRAVADGLSRYARGAHYGSEASNGGASGLEAVLKAYLEARPGLTLGALLSIDAQKRGKLAEMLSEIALTLAANKASEALSAIDLEKIVSERMDALDVRDVERIILSVMKKQFVWIDALGGVLGAMIGLAQAFLNNAR